MDEVVKIGPHEFVFEQETGFVKTRNVGELTGEHAARIIEEMEKHSVFGEPGFMLTDNSRSTGMTPEARKRFSQAKDGGAPTYLALYGGSFALRVASNLILKAFALTGGQKVIGVHQPDEASARAWLTEQKRKYASSNPQS